MAQFAMLQVTEHTLEARLKPVEHVWQTFVYEHVSQLAIAHGIEQILLFKENPALQDWHTLSERQEAQLLIEH